MNQIRETIDQNDIPGMSLGTLVEGIRYAQEHSEMRKSNTDSIVIHTAQSNGENFTEPINETFTVGLRTVANSI